MNDEPNTPSLVVLQIIRENGLIVLALVSLMYQAFILIDYSSKNQEAWRLTVDSLKIELVHNRELMINAITRLTEALVRVEETQRVNQQIIADTEEFLKIGKPTVP